jgi:hypothetical protein
MHAKTEDEVHHVEDAVVVEHHTTIGETIDMDARWSITTKTPGKCHKHRNVTHGPGGNNKRTTTASLEQTLAGTCD